MTTYIGVMVVVVLEGGVGGNGVSVCGSGDMGVYWGLQQVVIYTYMHVCISNFELELCDT